MTTTRLLCSNSRGQHYIKQETKIEMDNKDNTDYDSVNILLMLSGLHNSISNGLMMNEEEKSFINVMIDKYYKLYFRMKKNERLVSDSLREGEGEG